MRLLCLALICLLAMPVFGADDKPPLPDPNDSTGWSIACNLDELRALSENTEHLQLYDADNDMLVELKRFEALQSLTLRGTYDDIGVRSLSALKGLRDLQIDCPNLSNPALATIGQLHELEWLGLEQCSAINNKGLENLAGLTKLTWLIIHGRKFGDMMPVGNKGITDAGLKFFSDMKEMKQLDISGCAKILGKGFKDCLPKMKALESLDLMACDKLGDDALAGLSKHPKLKTMRLIDLPELGDAGIAALSSLKALESLTIQSCGITQGCLKTLSKVKKLETLVIQGKAVVGADGLVKLAISKSLKTLQIDIWQYSAGSMGMPPGMGGGDDIDENAPRFDDNCLKIISKFRALEQLHLSGMNDITDAGLEHFKNLKLISVWLARCDSITTKGIAKLAKIKTLRRLNLSNITYGPPTGDTSQRGPQVTDETLEVLSSMKSLTELDLSGQRRITDAGLVSLSDVKTLVILKLSMTDFAPPGQSNSKPSPITDVGISALAELTYLEQLDISGTALTDKGLSNLHALKSLTWLSIHTCPKVTQAGITAAKAALPSCAFSTDEDRPQD